MSKVLYMKKSHLIHPRNLKIIQYIASLCHPALFYAVHCCMAFYYCAFQRLICVWRLGSPGNSPLKVPDDCQWSLTQFNGVLHCWPEGVMLWLWEWWSHLLAHAWVHWRDRANVMDTYHSMVCVRACVRTCKCVCLQSKTNCVLAWWI